MNTFSLTREGVFLFMGESFLISRSGGSGSWQFKTEIITTDTSWVAPEARNQEFSVRIFGGGGGGSTGCIAEYSDSFRGGGGGGYMNNAKLTLTKGTQVPIRIGKGGSVTGNIFSYPCYNSVGSAGGTTSFGTYLSAAGGQAGSTTSYGGGGSGGSGGGAVYFDNSIDSYGGNGYQFGGGGSILANYSNMSKCGRGGTYGGDGGVVYTVVRSVADVWRYAGSGTALSIDDDYLVGGGEYNGGFGAIAGGGGWGAKGGVGIFDQATHGSYTTNEFPYTNFGYGVAGGGGGGYGKFGYGGDAYAIVNGSVAGGGGAYGRGGSYFEPPLFGGGGASGQIRLKFNSQPGADGVCIIQYWAKV